MFDIILFGASGFTGLHCILHLFNLTKNKGRALKWAISGRSEGKLKCALEKVGGKIDADLSSIPVILADVNDYDSLLKMTKQTKLLLNCCGPYRHTGENVVKACLETGTHHLDISAELDYSLRLDTYHEEAKEKGVYLLTACGFDSIIYEMGVEYLQRKFNGVLNSVEVYLHVKNEGKQSGPVFNYSSWASVINIMSNFKEYSETCKRATQKNIPKCFPVLKKKLLPYKSDKVNGWVMPLFSNDEYVLKKTQEYFYTTENKRPVQIATYQTQKSLLTIICILLYSLLVFIMVKFETTKRLVLNHPYIFSFGHIGKGTPPEENVKNYKATVILQGEGWKEYNSQEIDHINKRVEKCISASISAYNPAYGATALFLVLAGILVLTEKDRLAGNKMGGVYTPGVLFSKTSMIKELCENGVSFEIDYIKDL